MAAANPTGVSVRVRYAKPEMKTALDATGRGDPTSAPGFGGPPLESVPATVEILDARALQARSEMEFSLATNGFLLVPHTTRCPDFRDKAAVRRIYYREVTELVKRVTGAAHAVVADHTLRTGGDEVGPRTGRNGKQTPMEQARNNYADMAHIDSNSGQARDGPRRFASRVQREQKEGFGTYGGADALPAAMIETPEVLRREDSLDEADYDYVTYNLWQPFDREVQQNPLALLDARTLDPENDFAPFFSPASRKFGGSTALTANPKHQWYYFPKMQTNELLLFCGHKHPADKDPQNFPGSNRFCAHTSFRDPTVPVGALGRRSIEIRAIAAFPKKGKKKARL